MKKQALVAIFVLFFAAAATAGDGVARVSMLLPPMNTDFWRTVRAGAEEAAARLPGLELSILAPAREATVEQQIQQIEDEAAKGAQVMIVAPLDEVQLNPVLADVARRGVEVILLESDTLWPGKAAFVGPNNAMGGFTAADYIAKRLNGVGKVAIITGSLGHSQAINRTNGAREAFRMNKGIKVVGVRYAGWDRFRAMEEMENLLTLDPEIHAVFCCSDDMALGALEAIKSAKAQTFVVGFDATPEALRSVLAGDMAATVAQNAANTGRMAVSAAYRLATGKKIPPFIDTGIELLTSENAQRFIVEQYIRER